MWFSAIQGLITNCREQITVFIYPAVHQITININSNKNVLEFHDISNINENNSALRLTWVEILFTPG